LELLVILKNHANLMFLLIVTDIIQLLSLPIIIIYNNSK